MSETETLRCPGCGQEVWDGPRGHKLAKCWGCGLAFDTMGDDEGEDMNREPITLEILTGPDYQRDEDGWENNAYKIRLRCGGRFMDTEWHQGLGITDDPAAERVLENMLSSVDSIEYQSFEEWADDYGYDRDSRKAERIYNAVAEESKRLRTLLGADTVARLGTYDDVEAAARALTR